MIETTKYTPYNYSRNVDNFSYFVNNFLANNLVNFNKFRTFVTEHGTRNTEHGTRNTEHGTRNTEHGTRNTEHGTPKI